ncbi:aspartyl-phosphate phosphatase Spo0E family protein, partial [Streptococcus suis]
AIWGSDGDSVKQATLEAIVETIRKHMIELAEKNGLADTRVVAVSQLLDKYLVILQRCKMNRLQKTG